MARSKPTFWCPSGCGKRVVGLNVSSLHYAYCKDGKRFVCWNCETNFSVSELEAYGNNMSRIYRQQRLNDERRNGTCPRMAAGMNEW